MVFGILLCLAGQGSKSGPDKAVRIVYFHIIAEKLLFPGLIGKIPAHAVTIFFSLENRNQMNSRPHLFADKFTVI